MSIEKGYVSNMETLIRAIKSGDIALLECSDAFTGEKVVAVVAMQFDGNGMVDMVPLAKLFNGNPYDQLVPPDPNTLKVDVRGTQ